MTRRSATSGLPSVTVLADNELKGLLEDIEQEETPERLLELARQLQRLLVARKQRQNPN